MKIKEKMMDEQEQIEAKKPHYYQFELVVDDAEDEKDKRRLLSIHTDRLVEMMEITGFKEAHSDIEIVSGLISIGENEDTKPEDRKLTGIIILTSNKREQDEIHYHFESWKRYILHNLAIGMKVEKPSKNMNKRAFETLDMMWRLSRPHFVRKEQIENILTNGKP